MLNTEQDAVVTRGEQRRTFSPARAVGSKQPSFLGSSSLSTSPLGQLWGPHRESPTPSKRFAGTELEQDEANFFAEGSGSDYNSAGFGSGKNLFGSGLYSLKSDLETNLDLDLTHLDLGPDFEDHDEQRSPVMPPYSSPPFVLPSLPTPPPQPQAPSYLSTLTKDVPSIQPTQPTSNTNTNNNAAGRGTFVRIQKRGTNN